MTDRYDDYELRGPELWWCVTPPMHDEYAYPVKGCDPVTIVGIGALPDIMGPEIRLVHGYGYRLCSPLEWCFAFELEEAYSGIEEMEEGRRQNARDMALEDAANDEDPA
tara:strand:- start:260 stop:586 length:327 start_codon:yes stop_codon:yes gene_type:complete